MLLARLAAIFLCLSVTLGERVGVTEGGLDPAAVAFVLVAAALWVHDGRYGAPRLPYKAVALNTVGPLLALLVLLPLLGVLINGFALTTLANWLLPAFILAVLSLSRARRFHGLRLDQYGYAMVFAHGIYGLGQTLNRIGLLPDALWGWATTWDAASSTSYDGDPALFGLTRSTGLFGNPNSFGLWSALALVFADAYLKGRRRTVAMVLGVLGIIGSQSRTALAVLVILAACAAIRRLRRDASAAGRVVGWSLVSLPAVTVAALLGWLPYVFGSALWTRIASALGIIGGGVQADANFGGRYDAWGRALDFSRNYPFGTLGGPGNAYDGFIDNQYVSLFLQGGVLLVAVYVFALMSPLVLARRGVPHSRTLGMAAVVVAVSSITMQPLGSSGVLALIWLMAAVSLGQPQVSDGSLGCVAPDRSLRPDRLAESGVVEHGPLAHGRRIEPGTRRGGAGV